MGLEYILYFVHFCFRQLHHKEKMKTEEFNLQDKAERDLFTHLQAAVKTSHEKEKIHTNSAKYWSIVGSLLGKLKIDINKNKKIKKKKMIQIWFRL